MPPALVVAGDSAALEHALAKMVANALDYGQRTVELSVLEQGERVGLHLRDARPGFPGDFIDEDLRALHARRDRMRERRR